VAYGPAAAPAVILLHGAATTSMMWARNASRWSTRFRIYAVDIIGEPGFSAPSRPPLTSDAHARWMDDVWSALKLSRASMVGASLGGLLALDYAIRRPGKVEALALLAPAGVARIRPGYLASAVPLFFMGRRGRRKALELFMGLPPEEMTPAAVAFLEFCELVMAQHRIRTQRLPRFSDELLRGLKMPLLAVLGAKDIIFSARETQRRLQSCVPQARIVCLPTAGHGLTNQTETIFEFLSEAVRR
jgi:pimeloyl-ACP methyl ester carboxylesterase